MGASWKLARSNWRRSTRYGVSLIVNDLSWKLECRLKIGVSQSVESRQRQRQSTSRFLQATSISTAGMFSADEFSKDDSQSGVAYPFLSKQWKFKQVMNKHPWKPQPRMSTPTYRVTWLFLINNLGSSSILLYNWWTLDETTTLGILSRLVGYVAEFVPFPRFSTHAKMTGRRLGEVYWINGSCISPEYPDPVFVAWPHLETKGLLRNKEGKYCYQFTEYARGNNNHDQRALTLFESLVFL